ncbi:MAG: tetratricopeptide repeat protein [Microcoleaceae cyanobacterium]
MLATNPVQLRLSDTNESIYLRLKQALSLRLRRQILIAVCDDLHIRNQIVTRLETELTDAQTDQPLVSLKLNLNQPNVWSAIASWYAQHQSSAAIGFQIVGVEHLTRQSPSKQWSFLRHLRTVETYLPKLEPAIVLWISSPWLCCIQQSAPEFWRWRTGVFEFVGEPTPTTSAKQQSEPFQEEQSSLTEVPKEPDSQALLTETENPSLQPSLLQQTLAEIEQQKSISTSTEYLAQAYRKLAEVCRTRLQTQQLSEAELTSMIEAYDRIVETLEDETENPLTESETLNWLNDLGTLHWMRFRQQQSIEMSNPAAICDLEQSIIFYQKALVNSDPETYSSGYARLQKNLGAAYSDLATIREPVNNLKQAIAAYTEATRYFQAGRVQNSTPARDQSTHSFIQQEALQYASTQNNLGTAYWNLAQQIQPIDHLKAAISAYHEAIQYCDPNQDALQYAMIQTNLGTAYWNLAQHSPSEPLLQSAIEAYQAALQYRTPETAPGACANTQNNLGIAYWHLANHHPEGQVKVKLIFQAISAYETALDLVKQLNLQQLSFDPGATQNNLGLAHYHLGTYHDPDLASLDRMPHLNAALHYHLQAIVQYQQRSRSDSPEQTQHPNTDPSGFRCTAMSYLIRTIRACYRESGLEGQNHALSQIPSNLLPEVLRSL